MDRKTLCAVLVAFFCPMFTRGRPLQLQKREWFSETVQSVAEGDVECFTEYMDLWVQRSRIEGLRLWLSGALRIPASLASLESLNLQLSACGYSLHRDPDRNYIFRVMYSGCFVQLERGNYILLLNLMKRLGRFGGRSHNFVMKCPLVTVPPGGEHVYCTPDYIQVTRPMPQDSLNNKIRWSLALRGELVVALEDSSLIQLRVESSGSNISVQGRRNDALNSVEIMGRTIDILPLSLVSGYYAYSMEASCPNVSSSPAEETVLHISKRRMGLIKRGGYDKDSLTVNTVLVKQTNSFSVLENKEYLQISIPTAHILQEKNCTDPPGELFLQPFFKVDVIVTFKEMPYRFPWSIENVFPCVESQSTSPSSVAVTPAQEHKSTTANLYDTISTASAAARVGSTLDPRGPTDSSLYSKDARARESSSPSAEMALAADRGARAANPTPSPRELQPSEASTEGQESSTSVIAEWKTSAEQVTSTGARVDPSLALPTAVKVAWSLPELEHNPSWPSPLLLTSASQPTSSDVLVRTESGEYSTEPHPTGSETSIPYGDDPVLLTTSPHVGSKQLQEEKRGGGKLSSNCSEDESGSPTGLQSSARVEERVVEGNENHQISSPCGMAPPRISDLTSFNATKSPRFWEDNTSVEEDGSWTTTQPAPSTNKSPPLMASTSNNETTAAVTLLLYRFIAGETEMGDIPSEPSPHGNAEQDSTDNKQMQATAALPGTALGQRLSTTSLADTSEFQTSSSGTTSANRISVDVTAAMQHSSFSSAPWGSLPGQNGTDSPAQETGASFPTATTDHWA